MTQLHRDDFLGGATAVSGTSVTAGIGEFGWNTIHESAQGSVSQQPARDGRLGIVRVSSSSSSGRQGLYLGSAASGGKILQVDQLVHVEFTIALISNRFRFGLGVSAIPTGFGAEGLYLQAQPGGSPANWAAIVRTGNTPTVKDTGVELAYGPDEWLKGKFERMIGEENVTLGWKVYIDDTLVATFEDGTDPQPDFNSALLFGAQSTHGDSLQSHADIDAVEFARL